MHYPVRLLALACLLMAFGCAHKINITPPLNTIAGNDLVKIDKTVGYYISPADRAKEVITPGGGGDRVKYLPYLESEPALNQMLGNLFTKVVAVASLADQPALQAQGVSYIFVPKIETDSSSSSAFTWPPTKFTVSLDCQSLGRDGGVVWQTKVTGEGQAEFSEFKHDFSLAARRASKNAFLQLQQEIHAASTFRN